MTGEGGGVSGMRVKETRGAEFKMEREMDRKVLY
jgi:hypothetical protein